MIKTIKIKVTLDDSAISWYNETCYEMTWLWNKLRAVSLQNHTETWYKWAEKPSTKKLFGDYDLEGIIRCPIYIKDTPFVGASCRIATGGNYWKRDESIKISYKSLKGEILYKAGYKLVKGDKPYTTIKPQEFSYLNIDGKDITHIDNLDSKKRLNVLRARENLPPIKSHSDFIGGMIRKDFDVAWKAFLSPILIDRKKIRFKDESVTTLTNTQTAPKFYESHIEIGGGKKLYSVGKYNIPKNPRTYSLSKYPSGFYLCVSCEYEVKHKPVKPIVCGIDPGIKNIIATDHGAKFNPNISREKIEIRIEKLQRKLSRLVEINNKRLGRKRSEQKTLRTTNEQKLINQIARLHEKAKNSSNAFNHKLSTRLSRTYSHILWEDTKLKNLTRQVEPKLSGEFDGYEQNGASAKSGLNRMFRVRCIGSLKDMVKSKVNERDGKFELVPSKNTSQLCHCCGHKGNRLNQSTFICTNQGCELFDIEQHADVNAAKNIKKAVN